VTESDWLNCVDPTLMLYWLRDNKVSERKLRLLACGCCRRIDHLFRWPKYRVAVDVAERYADGVATEIEIAEAHERCSDGESGDAVEFHIQLAACLGVTKHRGMELFEYSQDTPAFSAAENAMVHANGAVSASVEMSAGLEAARATSQAIKPVESALLRDIFPNPFRSITLNPRWLTSTVVDLAAAIYDEKAFDRMPILGDALMDAGSDNEEILAHCRGEGPHVRGCWVVDLLLGKE